MNSVTDFMEQMRIKCEAKAKYFAELELSVWNEKHESDLKKDFGYTDKSLAKRKKQLQKTAHG